MLISLESCLQLILVLEKGEVPTPHFYHSKHGGQVEDVNPWCAQEPEPALVPSKLRDTKPIPTCVSATIVELMMLLQATPKKKRKRGIMARQSLL